MKRYLVLLALTLLPAGCGDGDVAGSGKPSGRKSDSETVPSSTGQALLFRPQSEPREKAFSFLLPDGWKVEGGVYRVNPSTAGGPANAISAKCDISFKKEASGSVMLRLLPSVNYADLTGAPAAALFREGANYQGMTVRRMPTVDGFLDAEFKKLRPQASDVKVLARCALPEVVEAYRKGFEETNRVLTALRLRPITAQSGAVVVEYQEAGVSYKEVLFTALLDLRGSAMMWSNDRTATMRAPAAEAGKWKPVLDIIYRSIRLNPQWFAAECKAAGKRAGVMKAVNDRLRELDRDILAGRRASRERIQKENYLALTGRDEYVNPFSGKVEQDVSTYKYRWTTATGEYLYTDDPEFDPNQRQDLPRTEWKLTKIRQR